MKYKYWLSSSYKYDFTSFAFHAVSKSKSQPNHETKMRLTPKVSFFWVSLFLESIPCLEREDQASLEGVEVLVIWVLVAEVVAVSVVSKDLDVLVERVVQTYRNCMHAAAAD